MPGKKKYQSQPVHTSASRRILQTVAIKDLPRAGNFRFPNSEAPSPSVSQPCACDQQDCAPGVCCTLHRQCQTTKEPQSEHLATPCPPSCKGFSRTLIDSKQELIRSVARDGSDGYQQDFAPLEKRVSIQEPQFQSMDRTPDCCKSTTSMPGRSMQDRPIIKSAPDCTTTPKSDPCCVNCKSSGVSVVPNTAIGYRINKSSYPLKPGVQRQNDYCTDETCAKYVSNTAKSETSLSASVPSEDTSVGTRRQSSSEGPTIPKLRAMPIRPPTPPKRKSKTIAKTSSLKLLSKLSKSNMKDQNTSDSFCNVDNNIAKTVEVQKNRKECKDTSILTTSFQKLLDFFRYDKSNSNNESTDSDCSCVMIQDTKTDGIGAENKNLVKTESKRLIKEDIKQLSKEDNKRLSKEDSKRQSKDDNKNDITKLESKRLSKDDDKKEITELENKRLSKVNTENEVTKLETKRPSKEDNKNEITEPESKRLSKEDTEKGIPKLETKRASTEDGKNEITEPESKSLSKEDTKKDITKEETKRLSKDDIKNDSTKLESQKSSKEDGKNVVPKLNNTVTGNKTKPDSNRLSKDDITKVESKRPTKEDSKKDLTVIKQTKDKPIAMSRSCGKPTCSVNTCKCVFPPAYSEYFDCTGRISGNCNCNENN